MNDRKKNCRLVQFGAAPERFLSTVEICRVHADWCMNLLGEQLCRRETRTAAAREIRRVRVRFCGSGFTAEDFTVFDSTVRGGDESLADVPRQPGTVLLVSLCVLRQAEEEGFSAELRRPARRALAAALKRLELLCLLGKARLTSAERQILTERYGEYGVLDRECLTVRMSECRGASALAFYLRVSRDKLPYLRCKAADRLASFGSLQAYERLREMANDRSAEVREHAVLAIAVMRTISRKARRSFLLSRLESDRRIRSALRRALTLLDGNR